MIKNKIKRFFAAFFAVFLLLSLASCDVTQVFHMLGGNVKPVSDGSDFVPAPITEVVKTEFETCYADQLSPNERAFYDAFAAAAPGTCEFEVDLPEVLEICKGRSPSHVEQNDAKNRMTQWINNALFAVWLDVPSLFWMGLDEFQSKFNIELYPDDIYRVKQVTVTITPKEEYEGNAHYYQACITEVINSLSLEGATEWETIRNINDYLCDTIEYDLVADYRDTVYGSLVMKTCVCTGYSHAFQLLCSRYGITCTTILGMANTGDTQEGHMWNAVQLDGAWYAVDVTWNDSTGRDAYFMVGSETVSHDMAFSASHLPESSWGPDGKVFALVTLSEQAYRK